MIDPGTVIAIGSALYSAFGSAKKGSAPSMDSSYINNLLAGRNQQIESFSGNLASARASYLNSINNYQARAFQLASQNASADTASRGLNPNGGAYASELARAAVPLIGQAANTVYQGDIQAAEAVNNAYGATYASTLAAYGGASQFNTDLAAQRQQSYGQAMGQLAGAGIQYGTGNFGLNAALATQRMGPNTSQPGPRTS